MILQEELCAKFDESTDCLIMHKVEPSKLQLLSLQAAEKFSQVSALEQTGGGGPTSLAGIAPTDRRMFGADRRGVGGGNERIGGKLLKKYFFKSQMRGFGQFWDVFVDYKDTD